MHGNISYDTVTVPSYSNDNKVPRKEIGSGEDAPSCELMYDAIDSRKQAERAQPQLYEIPDHEFHVASTSSRVTDDAYVYY